MKLNKLNSLLDMDIHKIQQGIYVWYGDCQQEDDVQEKMIGYVSSSKKELGRVKKASRSKTCHLAGMPSYSIVEYRILSEIRPRETFDLFSHCEVLEHIEGLDKIDTSLLTNTANMFKSCWYLKSIEGAESWNMSNVKTMQSMFADCLKIRTSKEAFSPLSSWDTSSVENMSGMFYNTSIIDLSPLANWDVSRVHDFSDMFRQCNVSSMKPLENWNIGSGMDFHNMFCAGSHAVQNIDFLLDIEINEDTKAYDMLTPLYSGNFRYNNVAEAISGGYLGTNRYTDNFEGARRLFDERGEARLTIRDMVAYSDIRRSFADEDAIQAAFDAIKAGVPLEDVAA